jgi:hypothetical protein
VGGWLTQRNDIANPRPAMSSCKNTRCSTPVRSFSGLFCCWGAGMGFGATSSIGGHGLPRRLPDVRCIR